MNERRREKKERKKKPNDAHKIRIKIHKCGKVDGERACGL